MTSTRGKGAETTGDGAGAAPVWVVDGANVVGSRPDGWWRDRAGAARRLHERLSATFGGDGDGTAAGTGAGGSERLEGAGGGDRPGRVVLVLEGAARAGVPVGSGPGRLAVVHAPDSGDDTIVDEARAAGPPVVVVTADRGLRARVRAVGATVEGPGWLLDRLG